MFFPVRTAVGLQANSTMFRILSKLSSKNYLLNSTVLIVMDM